MYSPTLPFLHPPKILLALSLASSGKLLSSNSLGYVHSAITYNDSKKFDYDDVFKEIYNGITCTLR